MAHISVVIPVYQAEDCIEELYRRLKAALEPISPDFEIVLIEDCGGDRSWQLIRELARRDSRVKGIQFSRNFGQHYGITAGLDHCDGDWVVVMDCDLQDRPEEIPRLYAKAQEGYEIVLARRGRRSDAPFKRVASWLFYRLFSYLSDIEYDGQSGNFRIVSRAWSAAVSRLTARRHSRPCSKSVTALSRTDVFTVTSTWTPAVPISATTTGCASCTARARCTVCFARATWPASSRVRGTAWCCTRSPGITAARDSPNISGAWSARACSRRGWRKSAVRFRRRRAVPAVPRRRVPGPAMSAPELPATRCKKWWRTRVVG